MILRILGYGALYFLAAVGGGASLGEALAKRTGHPQQARTWAGIGALIGLVGLAAWFGISHFKQKRELQRAQAAASAAATPGASSPAPATSPSPAPATSSPANPTSPTPSASTVSAASPSADTGTLVAAAGPVDSGSTFAAYADGLHARYGVPAPQGSGLTQVLAAE